MNIYRTLYYFTIFILTSVTGLIIYSVWSSNNTYNQTPPSPIAWEVSGETHAAAQTNSDDWIQNALKLQHRTTDPHLLLITTSDGFSADSLAKVNGNIVVLEQLFNQFSDNQYKIKQLSDLTEIAYTGFAGATYEDLSNMSNVPEKQVRLYENLTGKKWNFFGEGILLTNDKSVIILRRGVEYNDSVHLLANGMDIPYTGIFEITASNNPVLANFSIDLNPSGQKLLKDNGLPSTFPALFSVERNVFKLYYFAGNFSHYKVDVPFYFAAIPKLMQVKELYTRFTNEEPFWRWYYPTLNAMVTESENRIATHQRLIPLINPQRPVTFSVKDLAIYHNTSTGSQEFFMKGVNLGPALPGAYFTVLPQDKETYSRWLEQMMDLNINTVRVYTLLPPAFYQALYEFNRGRQAASLTPLYFLQEIWPEEKPENNNYLGEEYNKIYHKEIEFNVDAVHGNAQIPDRKFRADGLYSYDVSPYLIGYLVGREMEPDEVNATDTLNKGYTFAGKYFFAEKNATPTEAWLAASCDYALSIESSKYNNNPLLSIVNWPTLDPIEHSSEWSGYGTTSKAYNDRTTVNINHIGLTPGHDTGFFGSYHIYPNFPDFMNNDILYANYYDSDGIFRYGGYLRQFFQQHTRYPAVVAEYGISTSSLTAHVNPNGLNHGGLTEKQQAEYIIRMTDAIVKEGYSGAIIFEWMNEWVKKTWTTDFYMIPYERHVLWHNVLDPEQNYGLLSYEAAPSTFKTVYLAKNPAQQIQQVRMGQNASYLELEITSSVPFDKTEKLPILISTYSLQNESKPTWEFALNTGGTSMLLVNPGYNWLKNRFLSKPEDPANFEEMIQLTNRKSVSKENIIVQEISKNISRMWVGPFKNNQNQLQYDGNILRIRLPYGLIGFSDPSSRQVLYDTRSFVPTAQDQIGTRTTDSITLSLPTENLTFSYSPKKWEVPSYIERYKDGFTSIANYFAALQP